MKMRRFFRSICAGLGLASVVLFVPEVKAAPTDFTQTSLELSVGLTDLQAILLDSMRDPNAASTDSMFFFDPIQDSTFFFPPNMTRRNGVTGGLTQTQVLVRDPDTFAPSFWLPLWTFGSSMGLFQPQVNAGTTYSFNSLPLSDFDSPLGQLLLAVDFNPASSPVEFDAGPGGPLEFLQINPSGGFSARFYGAAPFPTVNDSPAMMIAGELDDGVNPVVPTTFGARTDSGSLTPIPIETFPGTTSETDSSLVILQWGDFDGDGNTDRVLLMELTNTPEQQQLILSKGNGDGTFQAPILKPLPVGFQSIAMAAVDFDGNGSDDLVISFTTTNTETDPQGPGAVKAISDVFGAFSERDIPLPSAEQFPTWVNAMDCDLDQAQDDLVIVTTKLVAISPTSTVPHASDVVCYLNGDSANSVVVYPEADFNLADSGSPFISIVLNTAVGTLGCGDAWAGTAILEVATLNPPQAQIRGVKLGIGQQGSLIVDSVFAEHTDCAVLPSPSPSPGPPPLFEGSGCSLGGLGTPAMAWAWAGIPLALAAFQRLRRRRDDR